VEVKAVPDGRLPESVEVAAYYLVSEALVNVAKYADASAATVAVSRVGDRPIVEVADDGIGGADSTRARVCAAWPIGSARWAERSSWTALRAPERPSERPSPATDRRPRPGTFHSLAISSPLRPPCAPSG
jgi:hypothetical protein